MNRMKKSIAIFGAVFVALLMVSSVTAVDQMNGESVVSLSEGQEEPQNLFSNNEWLENLNLDELNTIDLEGIIDYITQIYDNVLGDYCEIEFENNQELLQLAMQISSMDEYSSEEMVSAIMNNELIMGLVEDVSESTELTETNYYANLPFTMFDGVLLDAKQAAINQLGEDTYNQILNDVSGILSSFVDPYEDLIFYLILREIAAIICTWTLLLFGQGLAGTTIAVLLILTVITIPLFLYAVVAAAAISLYEVIYQIEENIDWDFVVYQWGLLGGFIFLIFLVLPIGLVFVLAGCVVLPFLICYDMMYYILEYAFMWYT